MAQESKLQSKIINELRKTGWIVNKIVSCSNPGWPDIEAYRKGKTIFIEAKSEGKQADPLQLVRHEQLKLQDFEVFVIDSWVNYLSVKNIIDNM